MKMTEKRTQFLNHVWNKYGTGSEISKSDVESVMSELGIAHPYWFTDNFRSGRSLYKIPSVDEFALGESNSICDTHRITEPVIEAKAEEVPSTVTNLMMSTDIEKMVPELFKGYVSWGHHKDVRISSSRRYSTLCSLLVCLVMVRLSWFNRLVLN